MALAGAGAGINELTALAVTSELAPTRKRGKYVAVLIFTIIPFCPSVLWAQLIAANSSWRYVGLFCGIWAFLGLVMTAFFYFPPPRDNSSGLTNREIIGRIDFVGGFLSIVGMILFISGLVWGGYQVSNFRRTLTFQVSLLLVYLEISTHSCPTTSWRLFPHRLRFLGGLWCQVSHVSSTAKARSSNSCFDSRDHVHIWCQLLLCASVLADTSF